MLLETNVLVFLGVLVGLVSTTRSSKLQPSPGPMSTPYRNDHPVIYMNAFYDPKYHDSGSSVNYISDANHEQLNFIPDPEPNPTARTYTREEKAAILQKYKMLQNAKFKRGIANSVDFAGDGDSLAVESSDSLAVESRDKDSQIVVKVQNASSKDKKPAKEVKDQVKTESKKEIKTEIPKTQPAFNPHLPQNYYQDGNEYLRQVKDEFVHGRRKLRAYYVRPHKTKSLGNAFIQMGSQIGYW
ncbi:uncharacterized protein LOC110863431 [Folsomia candida]|uniref:uncharacterized protein LOC110863431 n=1 Tax=Folsomia candida TaxID=158441 RepID=UPI000B8FC759|nr:uncharacterized protein LOC110863431 [Folsomia candida]